MYSLWQLPFGASVGAGRSRGRHLCSVAFVVEECKMAVASAALQLPRAPQGRRVPSNGQSRGEIQERNEGAALGQHRHLRGPEAEEKGVTHAHAQQGDVELLHRRLEASKHRMEHRTAAVRGIGRRGRDS